MRKPHEERLAGRLRRVIKANLLTSLNRCERLGVTEVRLMAVADARALEREVAKLWEERFGHAPEAIKIYRHPNLLVVSLEGSTTPVERQIQRQGGHGLARGFRDIVWAAIRDDMASCVQRAVGCPVQVALHDHDAATELSVLVFLLVEPLTGDRGDQRPGGGGDRTKSAST